MDCCRPCVSPLQPLARKCRASRSIAPGRKIPGSPALYLRDFAALEGRRKRAVHDDFREVRRRLIQRVNARADQFVIVARRRSEEHTSELQSLAYLVCRLLLEKKKKNKN